MEYVMTYPGDLPFPPGTLQAALEAATNSQEARNKELVTGFATTIPYDTDALAAAAASQEVVWVISAGTGAIYGIQLANDLAADSTVTGALVSINKNPLSESWWRTMMVNPGYDGVKQTLARGDDGMIVVSPGRRGVA
jgi:hypothetical protein